MKTVILKLFNELCMTVYWINISTDWSTRDVSLKDLSLTLIYCYNSLLSFHLSHNKEKEQSISHEIFKSIRSMFYYIKLFKSVKYNRMLPVCHTYCTQTYVLAAKKSQCTGMKKKQIISDVRAMQIKKTEKACKEILKIYICHEQQ